MQEPLTTQPHFINKITLIYLLQKYSEEMQKKKKKRIIDLHPKLFYGIQYC